MKIEVRSFTPEVDDSSDGLIKGYPIVFNSLSGNLGGFRERVQPGAIQWDESLRADFNHDNKYILGTRAKGTLTISEDARGVSMECTPPDTQWARDLMVSMKRGDIEQGSFAFRVLPNGQDWSEENGESIRTLTKILVSRVSVVSDPAYAATMMQCRSMDEILADKPEPLSERQTTAGQSAPPASCGAGDPGLLRRKLELAFYEHL